MKRRLLPLLLLLAVAAARAAAEDDSLWDLLRAGGQVVLVRHAVTEPGVGDPPGFRLDDCGTQRNLSEVGRREAQRLGEGLRAHAVAVTSVLTSPWCRCRDTARLAFGREGVVQPALGNLFGRPQEEARQLARLREIVRRPASGNVFMVTHGSTVLALTGISPGTTEMVVLTPEEGGAFRVAGRLAVPR
jgi:broad specificity phosphatase PhoE